jgi:3-phenylpropionate/trans-cinnamate dioxygenase ferredoxin reductase subunit
LYYRRIFWAALVGQPKPYNELAWFWSDQGDLKLMIAGLAHGVFGFRDGKFAVVESVNRAGDHAAASASSARRRR